MKSITRTRKVISRQLTDTSFLAMNFSFFGRHVAIDSLVRDYRDQFTSLFEIHSECDVTVIRVKIPPCILYIVSA
jgi:hypothetical protein